MDKVYLQTYSLQDHMFTEFKESLKKVADIGYAGVEFAGSNYGNLPAAELKAYMKEIGLEPLSSHVGYENLERDIPYLAELGAKYIVAPGAPMGTKEEVLTTAKEMNRIGKIALENGLKLGYHNHTHEFGKVDGDKSAEELLIENTDPDLVFIELDVGWATCAGVDVPKFIADHSGRVKMIHVKEMDAVYGIDKPMDFKSLPKDADGRPILPEEWKQHVRKLQMADVPTGKGIVDWQKVKSVADANGAEAYVVEREYDYKGNDIFGCVKEDLEALRPIK